MVTELCCKQKSGWQNKFLTLHNKGADRLLYDTCTCKSWISETKNIYRKLWYGCQIISYGCVIFKVLICYPVQVMTIWPSHLPSKLTNHRCWPIQIQTKQIYRTRKILSLDNSTLSPLVNNKMKGLLRVWWQSGIVIPTMTLYLDAVPHRSFSRPVFSNLLYTSVFCRVEYIMRLCSFLHQISIITQIQSCWAYEGVFCWVEHGRGTIYDIISVVQIWWGILTVSHCKTKKLLNYKIRNLNKHTVHVFPISRIWEWVILTAHEIMVCW